jgi:hypothetical protein
VEPSPLLRGHLLAYFTSPGLWLVMTVERLVECLAGETEVLGENLHSVPLCPPQIPLDLSRARTRAAVVGSRRLTS